MSTPLLAEQNIHILHCLRDIIDQLKSCEYTATDDTYYSSSIGAHTRHILDHYLMFLAGIEELAVDYDKRCRDPEIETSRSHTKATIDRIIERIKQLPSDDTPMQATTNVTVTGSTPAQQSTIGRELVFLYAHTTHHHSLMGMIMRLQDKQVAGNFGYAPSTLKYQGDSSNTNLNANEVEAPCAL